MTEHPVPQGIGYMEYIREKCEFPKACQMYYKTEGEYPNRKVVGMFCKCTEQTTSRAERGLIGILHALFEIGCTREDVRAAWKKITKDMELDK